MLKRDIADVPNLTIDQKWALVHSDERIRWNAEIQDMKRQTDGQSQKGLSKDNPQWYLKKFLDQTITYKHAGSLLVSLRTGTMRYSLIPVKYMVLTLYPVGSVNFLTCKAFLCLQIL